MLGKIGVIAPYAEFAQLVRELADEMSLSIEVEQAVLAGGVAVARRWEAEGVRVVIGRGPTAVMLRKVLRVPVVTIKVTAFDVMDALYRAKQAGGRIAFADFAVSRRPYDLERLSEMLGVPFEPLLYRDLAELNAQVHAAARRGFGVMVGTGVCTVAAAEEKGMRGVLVHSSREAIAEALEQARELLAVEARVRKELLAGGLVTRYSFEDIQGASPALQGAVFKARQYAASDLTILITGESGTGKELFAQAIHRAGARRDGPFVAINCAAMPESLLESELFGYEDGAFTGARKGGAQGLFELAQGGTLLLDEVGEMPLSVQPRLLRALQERAIRRVGGSRVIPVDVRVIAATNRNLGRWVAEGRFREDLYYRLNVLNLPLPALRHRPEDLPALAAAYLQRIGGPPMPAEAGQQLRAYEWPGNVRELENFLQKYTVLSRDEGDLARLVRSLLQEAQRDRQAMTLPAGPDQSTLTIPVGTLEEMEREILSQLDAVHGHDRTRLARRLGISRTTLWKKLKEGEAGAFAN